MWFVIDRPGLVIEVCQVPERDDPNRFAIISPRELAPTVPKRPSSLSCGDRETSGHRRRLRIEMPWRVRKFLLEACRLQLRCTLIRR
jgi:hypothetical protein